MLSFKLIVPLFKRIPFLHNSLTAAILWLTNKTVLPSFLLIASPLLLLPYQNALLAFDVFQFLLLPLIALLLYELIKERRLVIMIPAVVAVLLVPLPLPAPQWTISISYYWQWAEGQSKVLDTFLLLSALFSPVTRFLAQACIMAVITTILLLARIVAQGVRNEVLRSEALSALYGTPLEVIERDGRCAVLRKAAGS